jgi:response regulator of citrate/malate metabolism
MPPEARVAIIEDDEMFRLTHQITMEEAGHHVVAQAASMEDAQELIPTLGELGVQVVLLDGNLTPGQKDGSEGRLLAGAIKNAYPNNGMKIVGVTFDQDGVGGADVSVPKERVLRGIVDLGALVTSI